jgi:hypothetical protein
MTTKDFSEYDAEIPVYCANHPGVQTYLRCGKCEKPICAKCRVSSPAGFRCYQCANLQVLPTYAVSTDVYLKGALGGFVAALLTGVLMGLLPGFEFWIALTMGIAVPEAVALGTNQKRGPGLQAVGMSAIVFGFVLAQVVERQLWWRQIILGDANFPTRSTFSFYTVDQYTILYLALALWLAYSRLK